MHPVPEGLETESPVVYDLRPSLSTGRGHYRAQKPDGDRLTHQPGYLRAVFPHHRVCPVFFVIFQGVENYCGNLDRYLTDDILREAHS